MEGGKWRRSIGNFAFYPNAGLRPISGATGSIDKLRKSGQLMTLQRAREHCTSEPTCDAITHDGGTLSPKARGKFTFYAIKTTRQHEQDDHVSA
jgi:hypothetical protein